MRVTESRMMELAEQAVATARDRAGSAAEVVSSGKRVAVPSVDGVAWAEGLRAEARKTRSGFRGDAIAASRERLADTDGALSTVGQILQRVTELSVQMGNDTYTASDRASAASEVLSLRDQLLSVENTRDANGQSLLAGTLGGGPAFDATGKFVGDGVDRTIATGEGQTAAVSVSGQLLTGSAGVDVYAVVDTVAKQLGANDAAGVRSSIGSLNQAIAQVADARDLTGTRMKALDDADQSRQDLEANLEAMRARALDADPVAAASDFTRAKNALDAAQALAQQLVAITQLR